MIRSRRVLGVLAASAIAVAGIGTPALAMTSMSHWSSSQCNSYKKSYLKKHPKASKSQKAKANSTLKSHGCSVRIK